MIGYRLANQQNATLVTGLPDWAKKRRLGYFWQPLFP